MSELEIREYIKNNLSITVDRQSSNAGDEIKISLYLDNEKISHDSFFIER